MALTNLADKRDVNNADGTTTAPSSRMPALTTSNLPNQNADAAIRYSVRQGAIGGLYGLSGATVFSLLAQRFCTWRASVIVV